ncbi:polyprenyl synthetase family protein [Synechococcus sp. FACHB-909]|uniref:polyprenyl synthetase family protein n=1 Tax=Synechococcus sp. FACHB-909 TaxID=2692863 RepID=UPI0016894AD9|nr:polyprenyl synthetase family protein [Synechococcus sp. FACHB-909]MBD2718424.1 polyprenyl synthetase family protein [Synechococcus sp. FACHB-909]
MTRTIQPLLEAYGKLIRAYVDRYLTSQPRAPYLHDLLADYPSRGGKMMRPCICMANARAFGGRLEDAIPFAGAVEILHNALLIHDDIQDESVERRGLPTLHALHGVPLAINAGDAMLLMAFGPLLDHVGSRGGTFARRILDVTRRMARETAEGQALDIGWRQDHRHDITTADYLTMVLKKTAWMATIWPAQVGMLLGTHGQVDPDAVVRFGFFLGATFQIQDDLLNFSPEASYGKEPQGDLFEAKHTLLLIHARDQCNASERQQLDHFMNLRREERTAEAVAWLADLMVSKGSLDYARMVAESLAGAARHEFTRAYGHLPESEDKDFIEDLVPWVFNRAT